MVETSNTKDPQLDKPTVAFIIERSLNKNVVVYEGLVDEDTSQLRKDKPMDVYWLDLDPAYQEKNRKKGKMTDRDELNMIERNMAYGVKCEPIKGEEGAYTMTLVALPQRKGILKMVDGLPKATMEINGQQCYLQSIFVHSKQGMIGLPKVVYVLVNGVSIESGEEQQERIEG
mmetsp:Transcript_20388/g.49989  ORF Transcript_20388/g.49989 Transcript_20388/m.49989 type:complete len:173 (-) Transcript_20388:286-804(-)|eukprot:CAMPEP_0113645932 /NCGR_PEP_ID=MMETSP0017_2-20120614/24234_1 /TAXON_ID=2856 /ORGANISM="Cylindrotheca closterium" /LENGTH=172 /DNA_ID=CAMNT_0000557741 /DNA_START=44 /DNA_END=562 /DNA_ORIENTATION=+ /assembly_acc=CAM_ASM_000147